MSSVYYSRLFSLFLSLFLFFSSLFFFLFFFFSFFFSRGRGGKYVSIMKFKKMKCRKLE